ncbi:MAG: mechanosensitive ion channel [Candidatus Sulfobium sp.]
MIPASIKDFFPRTDLYLIFAALVVTLLYLFLRKLVPRVLTRVSDKLHIDKSLTINFSSYMLAFMTVLYVIFVVNLVLSLPAVSRYAEPVLAYPIVNVEALRLSLASLVKGVVGFYVLLVLTKIVRSGIRMCLFYRSHGADVVSTIDILVYNIAMVIIVMISLSIMGISWKLLLPVAGALGIGIGFGVRDIANNFVSGFVILTSRTVKRGDWVTMGDNSGKIVDIGIRTATLRTVDNIDIIIPNAQLISNQLINWSYTDNIVRIHIPVGVSYGSDVGQTTSYGTPSRQRTSRSPFPSGMYGSRMSCGSARSRRPLNIRRKIRTYTTDLYGRLSHIRRGSAIFALHLPVIPGGETPRGVLAPSRILRGERKNFISSRKGHTM